MSIASACFAEYGNDIKKGWTDALDRIIDSDVSMEDKLVLIKEIVEEMKAFMFSE